MVSINNINNSKDNYENFNHQEGSKEEKTLISIFNTDDNKREFSVEEQKKAYEASIDDIYNSLKTLLDAAGFNLQNFKERVFGNINKDISLSGQIELKIAELNLKKGLFNVQKEILKIAKKQEEKEKEELINDIESSIIIKLVQGDDEKDDVLSLYNDFCSLINLKNEEHCKKKESLWRSIEKKFPSDN